LGVKRHRDSHYLYGDGMNPKDIKKNMSVRTKKALSAADAFAGTSIPELHIGNRQVSRNGYVNGSVVGMGGEVFLVEHTNGFAVYLFHELDAV
jgi:hypothetical protein